MARIEKTFQAEIRRAISFYVSRTKSKVFYHKIVDNGVSRNPFDAICIVNKKFYALEYKMNKAIKTFNFKGFFRKREHEIDNLLRVNACGGQGLVLINHFVHKNRINKTYCINIDKILNVKTLSIEDFQKIATEIPKIKGGFEKYWDLFKIFNR